MKHEIRVDDVPATLYRKVVAKAGPDLPAVLTGLLRAYAAGQIDPLADADPVAVARGARGGHQRAANMSAAERSAAARRAVAARWARAPKGGR